MKPEQIIRITSDKYHVTGTLEDYGVVIKLHFDYRGVSRTVGISRPLHESLADKSLEMMEAAIEQFSDPSKVTLHYWYIDLHNEKRIAHGLVTGHPRVEDTHLIHTSPVKNISIHSICRLSFCGCLIFPELSNIVKCFTAKYKFSVKIIINIT